MSHGKCSVSEIKRWRQKATNRAEWPSVFRKAKALRPVISGSSAVTKAWRVLRLRMEERSPDMEGSCEYFE
jgi:hypothetical protein